MFVETGASTSALARRRDLISWIGRNEAKQLSDECKDLCDTIDVASKGGRKPAFMKKMVDEFIKYVIWFLGIVLALMTTIADFFRRSKLK